MTEYKTDSFMAQTVADNKSPTVLDKHNENVHFQ